MNDIIKPIGLWISENIPLSIGIGLFIFCLFFEISKIKVYPLRWLWKLISWPFRKIDEQRTQSFKAIVRKFQSDIDIKLQKMTDEFSNNLENMGDAQTANCTAVKQCFTELEKRFDKLDDKQAETEERLDELAAARIKNHVFNFARQCRKGEPHSHEDFANLMREHTLYESLVEKYQSMDEEHKKKWENNVYVRDFAYIQHVYDELNKNNGFSE